MFKVMGLANDVYVQIGMIMFVGLLGKNVVLIVEFVVQKYNEGVFIFDVVVEGVKVCFCFIFMIFFVFIVGLILFVFVYGVGVVGNCIIGVVFLGGMFFGIIFGVLIILGFYFVFVKLVEGRDLICDEVYFFFLEEYMEVYFQVLFLKKLIKLDVLLKVWN